MTDPKTIDLSNTKEPLLSRKDLRTLIIVGLAAVALLVVYGIGATTYAQGVQAAQSHSEKMAEAESGFSNDPAGLEIAVTIAIVLVAAAFALRIAFGGGDYESDEERELRKSEERQDVLDKLEARRAKLLKRQGRPAPGTFEA